MDNLKEALEYLVAIGGDVKEPVVKEIAGKTYCNMQMYEYGKEPMASAIEASSLSALVDYIKNNKVELKEKMVLHVEEPDCVKLISCLNKERKRETLFISRAETSGFRNDTAYGQERFVIELQSNFAITEDLVTILKVAGNVEAKTTQNYGDDGVSQKTTIKSGIASKTDVLVPNPVTLRPYRTFLEVEQPESQFVFRISEGRGGEPEFRLIEAEGGLWKLKAKGNIKAYLEELLEGMIQTGEITVIA